MYTFGRKFELETDHKPLEYIYAVRSKPSGRIERWILRLQAYDYTVVYRPGKTNIADALSRLNGAKKDGSTDYDFIRSVIEYTVPIALTPREVEEASMDDPELREIRDCVRNQNWEDCEPSYKVIKDELTVYGGLVLRGDRIVIPHSLRKQVLQLAHEGHQGIVKTKNRLRSKVWWPKIDKDAERLCKVCHGCQAVGDSVVPEPMARSKPTGPWQDCAADLLGPLPGGENMLLVLDYYSRFYEVVVMRTTTSTKIIEAMRPMFARFGVPYSLKTDNGTQFVSAEFENFLQELGIEHRKSPPLWPQANGEVELQNRTLMKAIRIARVEKRDWKVEMYKFLEAYRATPQMTTGASPYYLMFNREMKTKLPDLRRETKLDEEMKDRDWENKMKGKLYADARRGATPNPLAVGDKVLVKAQKANKLAPNFVPTPQKVVGREGSEVTIESDEGVQLKRHLTAVKKFEEPVELELANGSATPASEVPATPRERPATPARRSRRERRLPEKLKDFVL